MSQCQRCGGKAQTYLCRTCESDLRDLLTGLARGFPLPNGKRSQPWLECMEDARLGRTRLGESARQSNERSTPLPVRLGPKHKWEGSPLEILKTFHGTMATWIRHLTETRGSAFQPVQSVPVWFIGPLLADWRRLPRHYVASSVDCAEWLTAHISAIACDEAAGELFDDVKQVVDAIERVVNRPKAKRFLGPCPEQVGPTRCQIKEPHEHPHLCATEIQAEFDANEATCPTCKTVHRVEDLIEKLRNDLQFVPLTAVELLGRRTSELPGALQSLKEPVARRTFYNWCNWGWLVPRAWRGRCGTVRTERQADNDTPMYWLADIRELVRGDNDLAKTRQRRRAG